MESYKDDQDSVQAFSSKILSKNNVGFEEYMKMVSGENYKTRDESEEANVPQEAFTEVLRDDLCDPSDRQRLKENVDYKLFKKADTYFEKSKTAIITFETKIPKQEVVWGFNGCMLGTTGEFSAIVGSAKSKKTFFMSLVVAVIASKEKEIGRLYSELDPKKNKILLFDTEQGDFYVQKILHRIRALVGEEAAKDIELHALRSFSFKEREEYIETMIYTRRDVGMVVIDGVKDLVGSINDEEAGSYIVSKLMKWSKDLKLHILTVIHSNKTDGKIRGHLGSEILNKAQTTLKVSVYSDDTDISIVSPETTRDKAPDDFGFRINDQGLPELVDDQEIVIKNNRNKEVKPIFNVVRDITYSRKIEFVEDSFKGRTEIKRKELTELAQRFFPMKDGKYLGVNRFRDLINDLHDKKIIYKDGEKSPYKMSSIKDRMKGSKEFFDPDSDPDEFYERISE